MKLSTPEISLSKGRVVLSARVSYDHRPLNKPETAWISYPEKYAPFLSGRADAFAAGLLPLAQALGEDLTIEGPLSPRLLNGLREYQLALAFWFPQKLQSVQITAPQQTILPARQAGQRCVTLFSGGVDSSFAILQHLPQNQPDPVYQVRGALFIHGLDIPLQNQASYAESLQTFDQHLTPLGIDLIPCATNLHYFTSGLLNWGIAHGAVIIACGLALDGLIANLVVPSSYSLSNLIPWGSSPMIDYLLSTETTRIIHHGVTQSRMEKVAAIANWEPAQNFLRVCVDENERYAVNNCSKCEKCLRTMSMLEISGALPSFKTFKQPFSKRDIFRWTPHYEFGDVWVKSTIHYARQQKKTQYVFPLWVAHWKAKLLSFVRSCVPRWLFNWLRKKKFPYQKDPFNPDFLPPGF